MTATLQIPTHTHYALSTHSAPSCGHGPTVTAEPKAWVNVAVTIPATRQRRVWCDECLRVFHMDTADALLEVVD